MEACSRRELLTIAVVSVPAVLLTVHAAAAQQQPKAAHQAVQYQDSPRNGQQCSTCLHFVAPRACALVQSPISPNGWCMLYAKKS